jgi:O-Antigen ligase
VTPFGPRVLILLGALALSSALCLALLGPIGLVPYFLVWLLALPALLRPLRGALRAEAWGALALFATAASADYLDDLVGVEQRVTLVLVLCTLVYLLRRGREARAVLRSPALILLGVFFVQQLLSAAWLNPLELWPLLQNRIAVIATVLAGAVLMRRPDGERLLPALAIAGALVSVPVMVWEVAHPADVLFPAASVIGPTRAGGLFAQPNNAGCAISFGIAFVLALRSRGQLSRRLALALGGTLALGLVTCASRGAMLIVAALAAAAVWVAAARRARRPPLVSALVAGVVLMAVVPPLGKSAARQAARLEDRGVEQAGRLTEVLLALSGQTEDLVEDDSSRTRLSLEALALIAERPLFGRGTRNFTVEGQRRSHVQFLDVLGENGIAGGALYAAFLAALILAVMRAPPPLRAGGAFVLAAWLLTHFDNHDVLEYRHMVLPLAFVCGLRGTAEPAPSAG